MYTTSFPRTQYERPTSLRRSVRFVTLTTLLLGAMLLGGCPVDPQLVEDAAPAVSAPDAPLSDGLRPKDGPLQIQQITPTVGTTDGDTIALIRGEGFVPGMTVRFGDDEAKDVTFVSDRMLTALVPPHAAGAVDVELTRRSNGGDFSVGMPDAFRFMAIPPDDGTDTDGDGRTDVEERILGYRLKVDFYGLGLDADHLIAFNTNSDPLDPDTDDDGLNDNEEFLAKSNPRDKDTDGDGLWDGEERKRWLTSPISIDSDGDARIADPSTGRSTIPPISALFDGEELFTPAQLAMNPANRGEIKLNATSPTLRDTDGDSVSDRDELDTPVRTPLLADMPQLAFEIVDNVDVRLDVQYAEQQGRTTSFATSFTTGESSSVSGSQGETVSESVKAGGSIGISEDGLQLGFSAEVTAGYERSWETTTSSAVESAQTLERVEQNARTLTETASTGSITAGIKVTNLGNITVQVVDLAYTVRQWIADNALTPAAGATGAYRAFAALAPNIGPGLTLAPGGNSGVLLATDTGLNGDRVRALLARPDALQIESAVFELVNDQGINFAFIDEVTQAQTARVSIDFGDGRLEEYRVATNVDRGPDSSLRGITMARVMDLTVGAGNWEAQSIAPPCNAANNPNLITNGEFESPPAPGLPTGWQIRATPPGSFPPLIQTDATIDGTPDDQILIMEIGDTAPVAAAGIYQQLPPTPATSFDYSFQLFALDEWPAPGPRFEVRLWRGEPQNNGQIIDQFSFTCDDCSTFTYTGTLNGGQPSATPYYFELVMNPFPGIRTLVGIDSVSVVPQGTGTTDPVALTRVRDLSTDFDATPQFWSVRYSATKPDNGLPFGTTTLKAGESVLITYLKDADGDGLYAPQEQAFGSSDALVDTDGDGLTDAEEVAATYRIPPDCTESNGGWNVNITRTRLNDGGGYPTSFRAYSNPALADSDGDGLSDAAERAAPSTDPLSRDTDRDGLPDNVDPRPTQQSRLVYVNASAPAGGNGESWATAYNSLNDALNFAAVSANDVGEIWVAIGNYTLSNRQFPNGVAMFGGFAGTETRLGQRTASALTNETVIIGVAGSPIFAETRNNITARLDGFTLQGSNNRAIRISSGGSSITLANCLFIDHTAIPDGANPFSGGAGGAIRINGDGINNNPKLTIDDCLFRNNRITTSQSARTWGRGGALYAISANLIVRRTTFTNNRVVNTLGSQSGDGQVYHSLGGAISLDLGTQATFEDCQFRANEITQPPINPGVLFFSTRHQGGAISMELGCTANFRNCLFERNQADDGGEVFPDVWTELRTGGAVTVGETSQANFENCVFQRNRGGTFGGALHVGTTGQARVINCTFHKNEAYPVGNPNVAGGRVQANLLYSHIAVGGAIGSSGDTFVANSAFWDNTAVPEVRVGPFQQPAPQGSVFHRWGLEVQVATRPNIVVSNNSPNPIARAAGSLTLDHCAINTLAEAVTVTDDPGDELLRATVTLANSNIAPQTPDFVSLTNGNLRLLASSPLIDAGDAVVDADLIRPGFQLLSPRDLANATRIVDGNGDAEARVDIGAYEFQPPTSSSN